MTRSKYGAVRTTIDGVTFASKREAARYGELKMLQKAGQIHGLELQPVFPLRVVLSTGTIHGAARALAGDYPVVGKYIADFAYEDSMGRRVIEDVKSAPTKTAVYRLKKKMVEASYGITITEVA